ncbi:MAG: glycosyltransferase family 4 protein [Humidesulfovibrio sp.]|uniref:glycosyltransferase family 4 protein n=1 Tax=Humidesulfovibrio sp. TaxID=2910988 RepID=UPI0027354662|nr:glycosyltransferase family 4 protein [Humidesulfovibrio sp.]MDP2846710.1 glycosyltransferase family 4 protein [Humidesulfovibrio sp.]
MRIVVIAGHAPSLVNFRGPLLSALVARGHSVTALAPPEPGGAPTEAALRALGVELLRYPLDRGGLNPLRDLNTLRSLRNLFLTLKPDLVLPYTIKPVIYANLAARWAKTPLAASLITGLGYGFGGLPDGADALQGHPQTISRRCLTELVVRLYSKALETNRAVIFQNPDDRDLFKRLDILSPATRVAVVGGSGVDLDHFAPAPPVLAHPDTGAPVFTCVARLLWAKGVGVFVEACRMLKRRHPHVVCRLVGPTDNVPDAVPADMLRRWREDRVVEILDAVDDVRPILAATSVFVLPSYREGAPRSSLEAMSMARPVVTTDVPGCRQTVEDGVTGFLVPPFEPGALMRAMERYVLEPELIAQQGMASRRLAEERFDVRRVVADMLAILPLPENSTAGRAGELR